MKIYYVANARMPTEKAHGIQLAKMCEAFVEQGIDLRLIVPDRNTSEKSIQNFYGLRVSIPTVRIPVPDWYTYGHIGFFISSCIFALGYFFYLLKKRIRGEKGIIYTIDIDQFSFFLIPFVGMPYFAEIHDAKRPTLPFTMLFKSAKGIMVINEIIKQKLMGHFALREEKIKVCPNGVDVEHFDINMSKAEARSILAMQETKPVALYLGKLYDWKGLGVLADGAVFAEDVMIYIVGGTKEELLRVSGKKNIPKNIVCVGEKEYNELPLWIRAADCVLTLGTKANEYSYYHTSPMKLFEYMASKKPIVASRTPANIQIVNEEEVFFYEPDSADDLTRAIREALLGGGAANKKIEAAYQKAHTLTWKKRARNIIDFIALHI